MKHILDASFRYRPSFDTDVRRTFERVRRQQQTKGKDVPKPGPEVRVKVLQLDQLKKASGS
ncbi:MAG: hypothetical protein JO035_03280 [Betaproteobacteria bacterium]|nr:hypothetical protein [Betaproteobacteria bacterium]